MMYMALTNFFFGGGGGGGGKGGGKGMGGLIISRFHLLYFSPSSSSTQKNWKCLQFQSLQVWFWNTTKPILISTWQGINRLALTPIIDQDKFFNIKQCEEDM